MNPSSRLDDPKEELPIVYSGTMGQQLQPNALITTSTLAESLASAESAKRKRAKFSCQTCHRRKVKCDISAKNEQLSEVTDFASMGSFVPCTNCKSSGNTCQVFERKKLYNTKKKRSLSSQPMMDDLPARNPSMSEPPYTASTDHVTLKLAKVLGEQIPRYVLQRSQPNKLFLNDYLQLIDTKALINEHIRFGAIAQIKSQQIPPIEICWQLIERFFLKLNYRLPIVNKRAFLERNSDLKSPPSLLLLLTILFAGARDMDAEKMNIEQRKQQQILTNQLFEKARSAYDSDTESDPVFITQSLIIFSCHAPYYSDKDSIYWAQLALFTAERYDFSTSSSSELRVIWWIAYIQHHLLHLAQVSMPTIRDVPPVTRHDLINHGLDEAQCDYILLMMDMCSVHNNIWKVPVTVNTALDTDRLWFEWLNRMPMSLRYRATTVSSKNLLGLLVNLILQTFLIINHKANIKRMHQTGQLSVEYFPSWAITIKSSFLISKIVGELIELNEFHYAFEILPNLIYIACLGFLDHTNNKDVRLKSLAVDHITSNLEHFDNLCWKWPVARQLKYQVRRRMELEYTPMVFTITSNPRTTFEYLQLYHCMVSRSRTSINSLIESQETETDDFGYLARLFEQNDAFWVPEFEQKVGKPALVDVHASIHHLQYIFL